MNHWMGILALAALLLSGLCACKKRAAKAYEKALSKGVQLLPGDTVVAEVGDLLLFPYHFADGVHPGWYTYTVASSDTQAVRYRGKTEFHFAEKDVVGGPAAGLLTFTTHQPGSVRLLLYKPYLNRHYYERDDYTDSYDLWVLLTGYYATPDSSFTPTVYEEWYRTYREADSPDQARLWKVLYAAGGAPRPLDSIDRTEELFAQLLPLMNTDDLEWGEELVDSLLSYYNGPLAEPTLARWRAFQQTPPLHPKLPIDTCYVRLR